MNSWLESDRREKGCGRHGDVVVVDGAIKEVLYE